MITFDNQFDNGLMRWPPLWEPLDWTSVHWVGRRRQRWKRDWSRAEHTPFRRRQVCLLCGPLSSSRPEVWRDGRWWTWHAHKDTWYAIAALVGCTSSLPGTVTHSPADSPAQWAPMNIPGEFNSEPLLSDQFLAVFAIRCIQQSLLRAIIAGGYKVSVEWRWLQSFS